MLSFVCAYDERDSIKIKIREEEEQTEFFIGHRSVVLNYDELRILAKYLYSQYKQMEEKHEC